MGGLATAAGVFTSAGAAFSPPSLPLPSPFEADLLGPRPLALPFELGFGVAIGFGVAGMPAF